MHLSTTYIFLILALAGGVIISLLFRWKSGKKRQPDIKPYEAKGHFFSPAEAKFYKTMEEAIGDHVKIFGQVRLLDVLQVRKGLPRPEWQKAFNQIRLKHVDFVICHPDTFDILCAIELDDATHQKQIKRIDRDRMVNKAFAETKTPLVRFPTNPAGYTTEQIKAKLWFAIKDAYAPKCPKCSLPMKLRKAGKGASAGTEFWGCRDFPDCSATLPISAQE